MKIKTNKDLLLAWRSDPCGLWHKQFFDKVLWDKQQEVLLSLRDNKYTAAKSGNTVGKSYVVAKAALWFMTTHYPSKVITTAPTWTQVEDIIWKEIASSIHKSKIPFEAELTKTQLKFNPEWFAIGLSTNEVNRFQGFHSPYLLVIIDEALGVAPEIWEAITGLHPYRILAIGNPLDSVGDFYNCFQSTLWHKITISCDECVTWQDKNGVIPGLVTREWINERVDEWGRKSPLFQSRVNGEFPEDTVDTLIARKWVRAARDIEIDEDDEEESVKIEAVDVASKHGENKTVFTYRYGHTIPEMRSYQSIPLTQTRDIGVWDYIDKKLNSFVIDADGMGCMIEKTEIFTKDGWKRIEDITLKDTIYSKDKEENLIEAKVKSIRKINSVECIDTKDISFSFSHFVRCKTRKEYPWKLKAWQDICDKDVLLDNTFKWKGKEEGFKDIKSVNFAEFLGWFISEGSLDKNRITISQSIKSKHLRGIESVLSKFNYTKRISKSGEITYRICGKSLYLWLNKHCYKNGHTGPFKIVPRWLKDSSSKVIRAFLNEFLKGDGYIHKGNNVYYTSSKILADDLLELIYKTGKYGVKRKRFLAGSSGKIGERIIKRQYDGYTIYEYKNNNIVHKGRNRKISFKRGDVWELKVDSPTTLFFLRFKDNRAFWVYNEGLDDMLREKHVPFEAFHGGYGQRAIDENKFRNLRTQFYWIVAKKFEKGLYSLKQLGSKEFEILMNQLCSIKVKPADARGRLQIETKEDMMARGVKSPDFADSFMMAEFGWWISRNADIKPFRYR